MTCSQAVEGILIRVLVFCFCFLLAADAALVPQELLRRESSEFGPMMRDPFYVVSAGARWVCVHVPCVTAGPALAIPSQQQLSWVV